MGLNGRTRPSFATPNPTNPNTTTPPRSPPPPIPFAEPNRREKHGDYLRQCKDAAGFDSELSRAVDARKRLSSLDILSSKRAPRDYYKGKNCKPTGFHTRKGGYVVVDEKLPRFVVPDLTDFKMKPYVSQCARDLTASTKSSTTTAESTENKS